MLRRLAILCALIAPFIAVSSVAADPAIDNFARDLHRTESVRAIKSLQRDYAQYAQFGLWDQVGTLFTSDGQLVFDGQIKPAEISKGPAVIAQFLRTRYGGGRDGLTADGLSTMMIENPVVNLSVDGNSAKARWDAIIFHGHDGNARIEGGIFENDYVDQGGKWKIQIAHFYPQYDGVYEDGWTNWGGGDLPIVPKHFTVESAGIPIPVPQGVAPTAKTTLAALQKRVDDLNDEDRVLNLQSSFGFYQDRKMWDDVVDLFATESVVEVGGQGIWRGPAAIRRWLESMGPANLQHGELNDRVQFDVTVTVAAGGNEAFTRGIELGMLGDADRQKGWWEISVFRNRFIKEDGIWKIREMRRFPLMKTDIFQGWGKNRIMEPAPVGTAAPDAAIPAADAAAPGLAMPAFLAPNPVTGNSIIPEGNAKIVAERSLTGAISATKPTSITLTEASRRLARAAAYDGAMNVSAAYGYYLDDGEPEGFAGVLAEKGFKESPFSGFYIGRDRVIKARVTGPIRQMRSGISYHWLIQPVLLISDDGRSVTGHIRLFQPRTARTVDPKDFNAANFWGGMYYNQYVLEHGVWRIWNLSLDEPLITPAGWKNGEWAGSKDPLPTPPGAKPRIFLGGNFPPDITLKDIGKREEHWPGGPGETYVFPQILPVWFEFTNPVSGRRPALFMEDCVPCAVRPDLRLDHNGWQQTPDAPQANKSP